MLASLTTTAVSRGWPPHVYTRLVSQLKDSTDLGGSDAVLNVFKDLITENVSNSLLFEYICALSSDAHSLIFFPILLKAFESDAESRSQSVVDLISYIGRYAAEEWKLPPDYDEIESVSISCQEIIRQVESGRKESKVLLIGLAAHVIPQIFRALPEWRSKHEKVLNQLEISVDTDAPNDHKPEKGGANSQTSNGGTEMQDVDNELSTTQGQSSRALRLLWLDWLLRTGQCFDFLTLRRQLDLLWPGDRETVISYELTVTAFDVLASPGPNPPPLVAEYFVTRALPILLQKLNENRHIDTVIARVLTTLDKNVVEIVEQKFAGIRAAFCAACIDIGLCDPTAMHALHRSHVAKTILPTSELPSVSDVVANPAVFLELNPQNQNEVAGNILLAARGSVNPLGRHELARLCGKLFQNRQFTDTLFVHISARQFLEPVCGHANLASTLPDEDGGAGLIYYDLGLLIIFAKWLHSRYDNIHLPDGWSTEYMMRTEFLGASGLDAQVSNIMGQWIVGLFSGSGSGIADELLRPFQELGVILPALLQQTVRAYRSAVIDRETLKSGLDYFVHPFSVTLFAPLVVSVLKADLFEGRHRSSTLECLIFFLTMLIQKKTEDFEIGKAAVMYISKDIEADLVACGLDGSIQSNEFNAPKELISSFKQLVTELGQQMGKQYEEPAAKIDGLGETMSLVESLKLNTSALMTWQQKLQGAPTIPPCFAQAKSALGIEVTWSIIKRTVLSQSMETTLALLVSDGLWSHNNRLVAAEDTRATQVAKYMLDEFNKIFQEQPEPSKLILVGDAQQENAAANAQQPTEQDNQDDVVMIDDSVATTNSQARTAPPNAAITSSGSQDNSGVKPFDNFEGTLEDMAQQNLPSQDFDNDFVSQPMMNLADLDSAMDFAWE